MKGGLEKTKYVILKEKTGGYYSIWLDSVSVFRLELEFKFKRIKIYAKYPL